LLERIQPLLLGLDTNVRIPAELKAKDRTVNQGIELQTEADHGHDAVHTRYASYEQNKRNGKRPPFRDIKQGVGTPDEETDATHSYISFLIFGHRDARDDGFRAD
jgi:hypothetical protein